MQWQCMVLQRCILRKRLTLGLQWNGYSVGIVDRMCSFVPFRISISYRGLTILTHMSLFFHSERVPTYPLTVCCKSNNLAKKMRWPKWRPIMSKVPSMTQVAFVKSGLLFKVFAKEGKTLPAPGIEVYWKRAEAWEKPFGCKLTQWFESSRQSAHISSIIEYKLNSGLPIFIYEWSCKCSLWHQLKYRKKGDYLCRCSPTDEIHAMVKELIYIRAISANRLLWRYGM